MLRHERFEEICAAASIGQATPEDLCDLEQHAAICDMCREAYLRYLNFAAGTIVAADHFPELTFQEAKDCLNSDLMTRRFFERAGREGIVFSPEIERETQKSPPSPAPFRRCFAQWKPVWALAAMVLVGIISVLANRAILSPESVIAGYERRIAELDATNFRLQLEVDRIRAELLQASEGAGQRDAELTAREAQLEDARRKLSESQALLKNALLEAAGLRKKIDETGSILAANQTTFQNLNLELTNLQHQLVQSQTLVAGARHEVENLHLRAGNAERALSADRATIEDLKNQLGERTAAWERERQLLSMGRDVTELMGARNLHIVDVVDTDPKGNDRPAFGRIFFTADKSLIFYAYDLNEPKFQRGNFEYRVWGRKEAEISAVKNLGVFYVDNKAQKRWVYKTNDTKLLREIDSVFVTLEPVNSTSKAPSGTRLMYAYLGGQPNHG